jgi:hypothetical protein
MLSVTTSISGQTGTIGLVQIAPPPTFAQIFDGVPQFYAGSSFVVQESLRIFTEVVDPSVVDVDLNWFENKQYLGSYQVISKDSIPLHRQGDDGYLVSPIQEINRYSTYTIAANPNVPVAKAEQIDLSACNFYLQPDVYLFPNDPIPKPGFKVVDRPPAFIGAMTLQKAPLADTEFFQQIGGIGLFLQPGVEGVRVEYTIAVINDIYTDYEAYPIPTCQFLDQNCQTGFDSFVAGTLNAFPTQSECEIADPLLDVPYTCTITQWVCPTDPTQIFDYYAQIPNSLLP